VDAIGFMGRLENGDSYGFLGNNNPPLSRRVEDPSGFTVLFEDKGPCGDLQHRW